ncbi:MAG: hypothetical protein OEU56_23245, partial [Rhodospirillales bacterium]|nr:hypothetical protein [Rhodospirillales bacterium]
GPESAGQEGRRPAGRPGADQRRPRRTRQRAARGRGPAPGRPGAKANRRWFEAWQNGEAPTPTPPRESSPLMPGLPEATRTEGPGFLVVPETLSPEDWTRRVKEYNRLMSQPDDPPDP